MTSVRRPPAHDAANPAWSAGRCAYPEEHGGIIVSAMEVPAKKQAAAPWGVQVTVERQGFGEPSRRTPPRSSWWASRIRCAEYRRPTRASTPPRSPGWRWPRRCSRARTPA